MLELVQRNFPTLDVNRSHIVFQFAGVRPLPASSSAVTQQISRDHSIRVVEPHADLAFPIYSLIGGKWTTFRAFAEQTADKALAFLGKPREISTRELVFGGGIGFPRDDKARQAWLAGLHEETHLPLERLETLFTRYGTRAEPIANFLATGADQPLASHPGYSVREIQFLTQFEKVQHVDDILLRRSLIAWVGEVNGAVLEEVARIVGGVLGWDEARVHAEVERASDILQRKHGVKPEVLAAQVMS
jgi:glycerol-3-phosphate dehydrogenase